MRAAQTWAQPPSNRVLSASKEHQPSITVINRPDALPVKKFRSIFAVIQDINGETRLRLQALPDSFDGVGIGIWAL